jgi:hypothetical protein
MGEPSAAAQRAAFARRAGRMAALARRAARMLAAHVVEPLPAVQHAERQLAVAPAAARLPAAQVPHAEPVQREAPPAVRALRGRGARPALLLPLLRRRLRLRRPYAAARRPSSPLPPKR